MVSPLDGVDGGGGSLGRGVSTVAVVVAPPGERAILRFLLERVSLGGAAAGFLAWLCWVTPAEHDGCCGGRCCGALLTAAAKVRCGVQLLLAVACCCCCCCGSWLGPFLGGCRSDCAAVKLQRRFLLSRCFSARFLLGLLPGPLPLAAAAGWGGLLERVKNSPSGRCTTVNRAI